MPGEFKELSSLICLHNEFFQFWVPFGQISLYLLIEDEVTLEEVFRGDEVLMRERIASNKLTIVDGMERSIHEVSQRKNHRDIDVLESLHEVLVGDDLPVEAEKLVAENG